MGSERVKQALESILALRLSPYASGLSDVQRALEASQVNALARAALHELEAEQPADSPGQECGDSKSKRAVLELCVIEQEAFVCGAYGWVTSALIDEIEKDISEPDVLNHILGGVVEDAETVWVSATWSEPEYDDSCGDHRLALPGYWDLDRIEAPAPLRPRSGASK